VPLPLGIKNRVDIETVLKGLGFVIGFRGPEGYISFNHPELILEFLVADRGAGSDKPYKLDQLGVNAQPLRFLNLLTRKLISVKVGDIRISLPHPALFALHKIIVSEKRSRKEKSFKDLDSAVRIMTALIDKGEANKLKFFFDGFTPKLRKTIVNTLKSNGQLDLAEVLYG
jgi:hypothetical protein